MHNIYEKVITMPVWEKIDSKIIMTNPKEHRKSGHTREIHKFCDRMVIKFIYDFFFIGYFCLVCYCQFTILSVKSCEKLATKCGGVFLTVLSVSKVTLILKLLILEGFLGLYHGHILSLSNESMISIEHLKWYAFERILYTTHSTNREKDSYNLTFNFSATLFYIIHIIFKT